MEEKKIYPVCVIGGGSAGTMAALRVVLNNDECLFFPGTPQDKKRSRALWVRKIENIPAHFQYKRGIEEPNAETLKWIGESAFKNNLVWKKNTGVSHLKKNDQNLFEITDSKGEMHLARFVILCTGVMDVQPLIQGTIETVFDYANSQTIDYCIICDGHHVLGKKTSIIGHGNGAAWIAILLHERYGPPELTIMTNGHEPEFQADTLALLKLYNVRVITTVIKEIQGEEKGKILKGFTFEDGNIIQSEMCFVALGMIVYNELAKELHADLDERGFVKADETGLTSISNLYVAGDLKANTKKQIYTSWDMAVNSANAINLKLRQLKRATLV
jgi:thioredoxin reductase (NADPH)